MANLDQLSYKSLEITLERFANFLNNFIEDSNNSSIQIQSDISKIFQGKMRTKVKINEYISRLHKYLNFGINTLVLAFLYIERFCEKTSVIINMENIHRLILVAIMISIKYKEDLHYRNKFFAKVGGISIESLNFIESSFLTKLNFCLYVKEQNFYFLEKRILNNISIFTMKNRLSE